MNVTCPGAIVYSFKVGSVSPGAGGGNTLLFAVGAAVIGGTSLFGGRGRISNAVIGGTVFSTVENGLGLLRQPAAVVFVVTVASPRTSGRGSPSARSRTVRADPREPTIRG